jgi:hypothetical protein
MPFLISDCVAVVVVVVVVVVVIVRVIRVRSTLIACSSLQFSPGHLRRALFIHSGHRSALLHFRPRPKSDAASVSDGRQVHMRATVSGMRTTERARMDGRAEQSNSDARGSEQTLPCILSTKPNNVIVYVRCDGHQTCDTLSQCELTGAAPFGGACLPTGITARCISHSLLFVSVRDSSSALLAPSCPLLPVLRLRRLLLWPLLLLLRLRRLPLRHP